MTDDEVVAVAEAEKAVAAQRAWGSGDELYRAARAQGLEPTRALCQLLQQHRGWVRVAERLTPRGQDPLLDIAVEALAVLDAAVAAEAERAADMVCGAQEWVVDMPCPELHRMWEGDQQGFLVAEARARTAARLPLSVRHVAALQAEHSRLYIGQETVETSDCPF